eukprot:m.62790 g.62790  ORF g.62790 m.62790 type:complete len:304 (-) comp8042_c0_seq1:677-1588(-)
MEALQCPGLCGRLPVSGTNLSDIPCAACPRAYRSDGIVCQPCEQSLDVYSILYLISEIYIISITLTITTKKMSELPWKERIITGAWFTFEIFLSLMLTLLSLEPKGSLSVRFCGVASVKDFYPVFFNPRPDYIHKLHCANEAAFPLLSFSLVFIAFLAGVLLCIRLPVFYFRGKYIFSQSQLNAMKSGIWHLLLIFPVLGLYQLAFGGVLYYFFPFVAYIVSIFVVISLGIEESTSLDMSRVMYHVVYSGIAPLLSLMALKEFYTDNQNLHYIWVVLGALGPKFLLHATWSLTQPERYQPLVD